MFIILYLLEAVNIMNKKKAINKTEISKEKEKLRTERI